jgi:hypothetical protein
MLDGRRTVFNQFDYSRVRRQMSWGGRCFLRMVPGALAAVCLLAALPGWAQYSGQVTKKSKDQPELRAIPRPAGWFRSLCWMPASCRTEAFIWPALSRWQ